MNELIRNQSLAEPVKYETRSATVWVDGAPDTKELRLYDGEDGKNQYIVYLMGDKTYMISGNSYQRIEQAIADGAKFVKINDDLINISTIRYFKKNN